jgi:SAM-dependent methyltransferase
MGRPSTVGSALERLQATLDQHQHQRPAPRVLEAGCGSSSLVRLPADATLVGLDISARQLERNHALHDKLQGDIQSYRFAPASFDLIVCWDVLEHLAAPERALKRLVEALAPGGLLVLGMPNALSLKGVLTKLLPFRAHVWVYRRLIGSRGPAEDGRGPFPTYMRLAIAPPRLQRRLESAGLRVIHREAYESPLQARVRSRIPGMEAAWPMVRAAVSALSRGQVSVDDTDVIMVAQSAAVTPTRSPEQVAGAPSGAIRPTADAPLDRSGAAWACSGAHTASEPTPRADSGAPDPRRSSPGRSGGPPCRRAL